MRFSRRQPALAQAVPRARLLPLLIGLLHFVFASPPPPCAYDDLPAPGADHDQARFALVDTMFRLPAEFEPTDLIPVRTAGLADDRQLRRAAVADLARLLAAAEREGLRYELQSGYRSFDYQARVFDGWVRSLGRQEALLTSARAGHSEHQLGTAIDLRSAGGPAPWLLPDWAETAEGAWLRDNAWRFGFIMSYANGETARSCYAYEPWHFRWFGRPAAESIRASGLSSREWLWRRSQGDGREP